ncbi:SpoVR family protein [Thalassotalea psychrophila]|uniref:SpoVR family protein n=1 Tax=Thalassotalea psychrophila TaxID=3065647 RepID=A0ABY9TSD8_9GAMM|nr:SpoVR family protein [Colwelliaceae bacterium SQ149]
MAVDFSFDKLPDCAEWTFDYLEKYKQQIDRVAKFYGLDTYPNQLEMITSEQMMDAYASVGMPIGYNHWSFGKRFLQTQQNYMRGHMGLAYEIVINSNPCITYLMEENTLTMQALVMAHASYGHNSFFKGNYLFQTWTEADSIIDYLLFAKNYIHQCEQTYGINEVEATLDACHALMSHGVDRYKRPQKMSLAKELEQQQERELYLQSQVDQLWQKLDNNNTERDKQSSNERIFPESPQENILYFIEKNAPLLTPWQREIVRIVRKTAQYFYPQKQTQVMNEGWACFWHYTIINHLFDEGLLTNKFMLEFLHHHTSVINQPAYNSPQYTGINPYALGFSMYSDIRRICEHPSDEDKEWFPQLTGSNWLEAVKSAMQNYKDESFISQYLSPHLIREFKFFELVDDDKQNHIEVTSIHNDKGYQKIRTALAKQYDLSHIEANIQIINADIEGDRSLTLEYIPQNNVNLADTKDEVIKHLHYLWQFDVNLVTQDKEMYTQILSHCPEELEP